MDRKRSSAPKGLAAVPVSSSQKAFGPVSAEMTLLVGTFRGRPEGPEAQQTGSEDAGAEEDLLLPVCLAPSLGREGGREGVQLRVATSWHL